MDRAPLAWVLHDGKAGMASQALGLAEATGFAFEERRLDIRPPWAWLPPQLWARPLAAAPGAGLVPPWPDLVIGCGRNTAMPALAIRRLSRGRTVAVQVQDPRVGRDEFDLMVVPSHDRLRGERVIVTLGAVHRVTAARLAAERVRFPRLAALPHPVVAVLLGGGNRAYRQDPARLGAFARDIAAALRAAGGSLIATPSRRTGAAALAAFRAGLGDLSAWVWDGSGDNPYYALLAYADRFVVTADSVSMVSEAAATGKPVQILDLGGGDGKFARFHQAMREAGITRPFTGRLDTWCYAAPDDTARAGAAVRELCWRGGDEAGCARRARGGGAAAVPVSRHRPGIQPAVLQPGHRLYRRRIGGAAPRRRIGSARRLRAGGAGRRRRAAAGPLRQAAVAARPQGAGVHRRVDRARPRARRQRRPQGPLGPGTPVSGRRIRRRQAVHRRPAARRPVRA